MPLPQPVEREPVHTRTITCEGFRRKDGLWDIDGWITDIKADVYSNWDRGDIPPGEPLHGMGARMTVDYEMFIRDMVAVTDFSPYSTCPAATQNFKKLVGLNLGKGFKKAVQEVVGATKGCVHLVDLLGPMATTAYQTIVFQKNQDLRTAAKRGENVRPPFIDTCHTWSTASPVVKREFPLLYTGS